MKKNLLFFLLTVFTFGLSAQETASKTSVFDKKNELKIDMVKLVAVPSLEIEYERIISHWSSVGGIIKFGDGGNEFSRKFRIAGFYRGYFTKNEDYGTKGFYGELLTGYYVGNEDLYYYDISESDYPDDPITYNGLEAGFKLGYKWVNKSGFIIQADWGITRGLIRSDNSPENFLLWGIKMGLRF